MDSNIAYNPASARLAVDRLLVGMALAPPAQHALGMLVGPSSTYARVRTARLDGSASETNLIGALFSGLIPLNASTIVVLDIDGTLIKINQDIPVDAAHELTSILWPVVLEWLRAYGVTVRALTARVANNPTKPGVAEATATGLRASGLDIALDDIHFTNGAPKRTALETYLTDYDTVVFFDDELANIASALLAHSNNTDRVGHVGNLWPILVNPPAYTPDDFATAEFIASM